MGLTLWESLGRQMAGWCSSVHVCVRVRVWVTQFQKRRRMKENKRSRGEERCLRPAGRCEERDSQGKSKNDNTQMRLSMTTEVNGLNLQIACKFL